MEAKLAAMKAERERQDGRWTAQQQPAQQQDHSKKG
jgi:hypothetical protein